MPFSREEQEGLTLELVGDSSRFGAVACDRTLNARTMESPRRAHTGRRRRKRRLRPDIISPLTSQLEQGLMFANEEKGGISMLII